MKKERVVADIKQGLTLKQVEERIRDGLVNYNTESNTKTVKQIIKENVCTLFNIINIILAVAVICVGSFKNLTFMIIIILNTLISIVQELRSKKTLDKLQVLASSKVAVIRDGEKQFIDINEIVLDDILSFSMGNQVVVDSLVRDGEVEVDESFITGEAETVFKKKGDMLISGSFIVSGKAICQVVHIGLDNYTAKLSSDTKYIKPVSSEIMRSLNKIVSTISFLIVPVGMLLFIRQMYLEGNTVSQAIVSTVAALIGMIPEGLVLLTSTVLAVSVIRLSKKKVLVQELYCIENLARVDVLCLDKTGTITEGKMEVVDIVPVSTTSREMENILGAFATASEDNNSTMTAIREKYEAKTAWQVTKRVPFSSAKKWSGITFSEKGSYLLGAPEVVLKEKVKNYEDKLKEAIQKYRVLVLGFSKETFLDKELPSTIEVLGFVLIGDKIRKDTKETLEYFKEQGVEIKIISGDNPITVSQIAMEAGVEHADNYIDATVLSTDAQILEAVSKYTVFGRVTPIQKKKIIMALKEKGHTVAMTGDGVNDVLALKEADCSIAVASGSDASRNVAQLVLLDSDFKAMPDVVAEGRRTINNIGRSATLFLVKTIYATVLAILFVFLEQAYPFMPIQLSLISIVTIGIPSFILALQPNKDRVKGDFLKTIISKAIPTALAVIVNILLIVLLTEKYHLSVEVYSTLCVISTAIIGLTLLFKLCLPFNVLRFSLFTSMVILFLGGILLLDDWFSIVLVDKIYLFVALLAVTGIGLFLVFHSIARKVFKIES